MAEPGAAIDRKAILTLRRRVRFQDGRPYDARCRPVAAALEAQFGWKRRFGRLRLLDARVCWQHCWNQLADGRILDADDPHATAYQPAPPPWTFSLREQEAVIELSALRGGAEGHDAAMPCASWMAAARQMLTMMTGWSLPDDLVDYVARALRVRALLGESMTSGQLDELLTMYEWGHAAASRGGPWMSSEYAAVLV